MRKRRTSTGVGVKATIRKQRRSLVKVEGSALHYDLGKPQVGLIPFEALVAEAKAMEYGAKKYSRDDWMKGMPITKLIDSCMRHLGKFRWQQTFDEESNLNHLAHARADLGILLWILDKLPHLDDRPEHVRRTPWAEKELAAFHERIAEAKLEMQRRKDAYEKPVKKRGRPKLTRRGRPSRRVLAARS